MRKRFLIVTAIVITGLTILFFSFRGLILARILENIKLHSEQSYGIKISYQKVGFAGIKSIYIQKLRITADNGDTILRGDSIILNPRLLPLLTGKKRLQELGIFNTNIQLTDTILRELSFKNHIKNDTLSENTSHDAQKIYSLQHLIFTYVPNLVEIKNSGLLYQNDSITSSVFINHMKYQGSQFSGKLLFADTKNKSQCMIQGYLSKGDREIAVTLSHLDTATVKIPFLGPLWHTNVWFDTLSFSMTFRKINKDMTDVSGYASASRLELQNKRIGPDIVTTNKSGINFLIHVGDQFVELDSSSLIKFNRFSFSPYLRFEDHRTRRIIFEFVRKEFEAQELFESLPSGLFTNFKGIQTEGKLVYHMKLDLDLNNPDSVKFESQLENKGFKIDRYGVTDFRMINGSFMHDIYENDRYYKSIMVGPENLDFVSLDQISPYFKFAVLTAEDGDFYYNKGFNERAFRESIATDIKEKRFARGGSTISMQLVKNIFLSKNKTISRKIEEALIVWIIENLHLSTKDRMFEVYLNIIELGPGVYGIKPAAMFYFKKSPANLTLPESIYLSSIIPRPKGFRYTFDENGQLRSYFDSYFKMLSSIMVRRNQLLPSDTVNLIPKIKLTGEAKKFLAGPDTIAKEDSLFFNKLDPDKPLNLNNESDN